MKKLVVYKDELNAISLKNFNSKEMDIFFSICSKMRNKDIDKVIFDFSELRELSNYTNTNNEYFISDLENLYNKLIQLDYRLETEDKIVKFVLFTSYEIDKVNKTISIKINEDFKHILNNVFGNFTQFELEEFTSLKSGYSKTAYRLLKQFRGTGYYIVHMNEFKRLFNVPESYQMYNITQRILCPIEEELSRYFGRLKINKLHGNGRRKKSIDYIEIRFAAEHDINNGKKTFRDNDTGNYYEKDITDFTSNEEGKTFPKTSPLSDTIEMNNKTEFLEKDYTKQEINIIYNTAMKKVLATRPNMDVYYYIKNCYEYLTKQKDVGNKYGYLLSIIQNDYSKTL